MYAKTDGLEKGWIFYVEVRAPLGIGLLQKYEGEIDYVYKTPINETFPIEVMFKEQ